MTTTDVNGRVAPQRTSWGRLPGGDGIRRAADRLRDGQPTLWIDTGDLCSGWLDTLAGPDAVWDVGRRLGPDVGVVGNHELDQGRDAMLRAAPTLGYPLLCANADLGVPGSVILPVGDLAVGVVGVTHPSLHLLAPGIRAPDWSGGEPLWQAAAALRRAGADVVVVAVHDGVDWFAHADGAVEQRSARFARTLRGLAGTVDLVVAGHTFGRWAGAVGSLPVLQPWAFGSEIGVADLRTYGGWSLGGVFVPAGGPWTGAGAEAVERAASAVVGTLEADWTMLPGAPRYLPDLLASSMLAAGEADVALVPASVVLTQPPVDGRPAHLAAGEVTELDLLTLIPAAYDEISVLDLTEVELATVLGRVAAASEPDATGEEPWTYLRMPTGMTVRERAARAPLGRLAVALPSPWGGRISSWLGRGAAPEPLPTSRRAAMRLTVQTEATAGLRTPGSERAAASGSAL